MCSKLLKELSDKENETIAAEIFLKGGTNFLGSLGIIFDSKLTTKNADLDNVSSIKRINSSPKRKMPPVHLNAAKKPNQSSIPASPAGEDLLTTKTDPESLVNITQNLTTGQKSFQCGLCGHTASQKGNLKRHIEEKHLPKSTVFKCTICGSIANRKYNLKSHYVTKHSMTDYQAKAMLD